MELIFSLAVVFHASAIGLGVGSSSLAISSFLVAIFDGKIDESERRMLGVIYWALRIAMLSIVLTTVFIHLYDPLFFGTAGLFIWILVGVLFGNAVAMTKKWVSSKIGPAVQAATWYTLGFIVTIHIFDLMPLDFATFAMLYVADIILFLVLVNGYLQYLKKRNSK